jgi:2'-5' RNA ligase
MKRLFFALWPDDETRQLINKFNQSIKSEGLKKVNPDNLHVTLVFLGNINAEVEVILRQSIEKISVQPFVLHFDQLDFWQKPRILCISTRSYDSQLSILVNAIKKKVELCGIKTEDRPYKPHITLARKARKVIDIAILPIEWKAESFCLVESCSTSNGVQYQVLQRWNFN